MLPNAHIHRVMCVGISSEIPFKLFLIVQQYRFSVLAHKSLFALLSKIDRHSWICQLQRFSFAGHSVTDSNQLVDN